MIQASSDYQAVQTQPLPQRRSDVQPPPGHAPPPGGGAQALARGGGPHTQGTRSQGPHTIFFAGFGFMNFILKTHSLASGFCHDRILKLIKMS